MKTIAKTQIDSILKALAVPYNLYIPVAGAFTQTPGREGLENASQFRLYQEGLPLHWTTNTCLSPKDLLFPQTEEMYTIVSHGKTVEIQEKAIGHKPTILFGIRSCDIESIDCMDRVFLEKGFEDTYYKTRRPRTILFALSCTTHEDTCFCTSMGVNPQSSPSADVQISDLGDTFSFTAQTLGGEQALAYVDALLSEIIGTGPSGALKTQTPDTLKTPEELKEIALSNAADSTLSSAADSTLSSSSADSPLSSAADSTLNAAADNAGNKTSAASPLPTDPMIITVNSDGVSEKLENMFEHPLWDEINLPCLGCGACTYVCPTCYCFDINDKTLSHTTINKQRCWDSCMFSDYTRMAGGHNPRPSKKERVRNRFLDKLLYNRQRHGRLFCVGCGRCVAKCPVNLEIATVIQKIQAAEVTPS
ncbi:MAG: 4Fe-4S dicluster domain-containing protein [Peptococcaceae bacterium]|nr:4Fe-4S dicluster domain-containing protein [Peptococcaceae bacterium]